MWLLKMTLSLQSFLLVSQAAQGILTNACLQESFFFFWRGGRFFASWRTLKNLQHKQKGREFRSPEPRKHWVGVEAQCNSPGRWRPVFLRASCLGKLSMLVSSGIDQETPNQDTVEEYLRMSPALIPGLYIYSCAPPPCKHVCPHMCNHNTHMHTHTHIQTHTHEKKKRQTGCSRQHNVKSELPFKTT